jgi:hypothetical protein
VRNAPSPYTFVKGQKVICVNDASQPSLKRGQIYTVIKASGLNKWIWLEETGESLFYANRFVPYSPLIKELV